MKKNKCQVHGIEEKVRSGLEDWNITYTIENGTLTREGCVGYKIGTRIIYIEEAHVLINR
jgi:hypothetical protein